MFLIDLVFSLPVEFSRNLISLRGIPFTQFGKIISTFEIRTNRGYLHFFYHFPV